MSMTVSEIISELQKVNAFVRGYVREVPSNASISFVQMSGRGRCTHGANHVELRQGMTLSEFVQTYIHELLHLALGPTPSSVDRDESDLLIQLCTVRLCEIMCERGMLAVHALHPQGYLAVAVRNAKSYADRVHKNVHEDRFGNLQQAVADAHNGYKSAYGRVPGFVTQVAQTLLMVNIPKYFNLWNHASSTALYDHVLKNPATARSCFIGSDAAAMPRRTYHIDLV